MAPDNAGDAMPHMTGLGKQVAAATMSRVQVLSWQQ
jgi:hypothetical protein